MGLHPHTKNLSWLARSSPSARKGEKAQVHFVGRLAKLPAAVLSKAPSSIKSKLKKGDSIVKWSGSQGPIFVVQTKIVDPANHYGLFSPSPYAMARDLAGTCSRQLTDQVQVQFHFYGDCEDEFVGACVGLDMGQYRFKDYWPEVRGKSPKLVIQSKFKGQKALVQQASLLAHGVNLSRFLVDCPPNVLGPEDYAKTLQGLFAKKGKTKVTTWGLARLKKEGMGLHVAVGQGAEQEPQMVHVEYRGGGKTQPIAFIGKGITFDSGGLDIKPAAGMRLMKKDMGGSASVAGLAYWVIHSGLKLNCDFYFAIAENAVDAKSFRPSDVLSSRHGLTVEIDNTDAEGRLVLADVMAVAAERKPRQLIDVATLTGAIKYGLGANTPGMFCNDDNFAEALLRSGQERGDVFWRMPLIPEERARLKSEVADVVNSTNGYGGAVTAALFLEMFTAGIPWAHFDIYAWTDSARGPYATSGGSGPLVQALAQYLSWQESSASK
jgi:leucyl aminopeptidase